MRACWRVALDVPLGKLFDYAVPEGLSVQAGDRVVVPFGSRARLGVAIESAASEVPASRLKALSAVRDDAPRLSAEWLELMRFLSGYYQRPLGETVISSLPPRLRSTRPLPRDPSPSYRVADAAPSRVDMRPGRKRALIEALRSGPLPAESLLDALGGKRAAARAALREMLRARWLETCAPASGTRFVAPHELNAAQQAACGRVEAAQGGFRPFLLHGVTGSGKTEIYLHLIAGTIARGLQALVLVPEIGLTPQLEARFRHAFPEARIAVLHSALEDTVRTAAWLAAARGEACGSLAASPAAL